MPPSHLRLRTTNLLPGGQQDCSIWRAVLCCMSRGWAYRLAERPFSTPSSTPSAATLCWWTTIADALGGCAEAEHPSSWPFFGRWPRNRLLKIIFAEELVEHHLDVMAGVPVAVVVKAAQFCVA